jgi:hypothetical protein
MPDHAVIGSARMMDHGGPGRWVLRNMDGAPADDRSAACACAQFRQGHSYRHSSILFLAAHLAGL